MTSRITPHGASKGDHISSHGRDLITKIRRGHEGMPVYRKFNEMVFRLHTHKASIHEANLWIEDHKNDFYIRKVRGPGGFYAIYVRRKNSRRGQ
jgi:hypothetical protein